LVFLNGRTDFIEKYFETYHDLLEAGWAIAAPEFRGQGLCDRELPDYDKGHVATYDLYVADCRKFMAEVVEPAFHGPMVLLGYSMGGLVAALYLAETGGRAFVATVLVAPLLRPKTDTAPNWLARSTARWMTLSGLGKGYCVGRGAFSFDDAEDVWPALVTSPERFYEVRAHIRAQPDLRLGGPTWSWLDASFRAIDRVMKPGALEEASPNLHFIVAERDQLLFNTAAKDLATRVNAASYSEVPNAQHDMFIERSDLRDRAMAEIMNILAGQAAAP
jgi:lysophospholipase